MRKLKITEMIRMSPAEFHHSDKIPLMIILDNVRSLHNIGSVFRTADAFRLEGIYLCGISATPPQPEIHKSALGAENSVFWRYFDDTLLAVDELQRNGYDVWAVEQAVGSTMLPDFNRASMIPDGRKLAVILGNEVKGVQQIVIDKCSGCIEIPQYGTKHSLNVSVTAGIIIWELFKQVKDGLER